MIWKHFTHEYDLDGRSCAIISHFIYENHHTLSRNSLNKAIDYSYEQYDTINESLISFLDKEEYLMYDVVLITDMGILPETAMKIQHIIDTKKPDCEFIYIDHHETSLFMNKYSWASVTVKDQYKELISATKLLYLKYQDCFEHTYKKILEDFVYNVSEYDTYIWFNKSNKVAKSYHDLMCIYGRDKAQELFLSRLIRHMQVIQPEDLTVLEMEDLRRERYFKRKEQEIRFFDLPETGWNIGIIYTDADEFKSELGNYLCRRYPRMNFIAMINLGNRTISYRSVSGQPSLGEEVALKLKGGGHQLSAGSPIPKELDEIIVFNLFKNLVSKGEYDNGLGNFYTIINRFMEHGK